MLLSLLFLLALLGVLSSIAWWQLPSMLNWGITQFLQQQGLTDITVVTSQAGASRTTLERLDFTYQEPDTALQIQLKQVRLDYTLSQLMHGSAESVFVGSVASKLDHRPNPQSSSSASLPNIELLLAAYDALKVSAFPVNTIELPKISISHNLASSPDPTSSASASSSANSSTDSALHSAPKPTAAFESIELRAGLAKIENQIALDVFSTKQHSWHWTNSDTDGWQIRYFNAPELASALSADSPPEPSPAASPELALVDQAAEQRQAALVGSLQRVEQSLVFSAQMQPSLAQGDGYLSALLDASIDLSEIAIGGKITGNESTGLALSATLLVRDLRYAGNVSADNIEVTSGETSKKNVEDKTETAATFVETINAEFDVQFSQSKQESSNAQHQPALEIASQNRVSLENVRHADWLADTVTLSGNTAVSLAGSSTEIASSKLLLTIGKLQQANELEFSDLSFTGQQTTTIDAQQWQLALAETWQLSSQYARIGDTEFLQGLALSSTQPVHLNGAIGSNQVATSLDKTTLEGYLQPEPSAGSIKEPLAGSNKEPSASLNKEPSASSIKEPSASSIREPSAGVGKEPSAGFQKDTQPVADSISLDRTTFKIVAPIVANSAFPQRLVLGDASLQIDYARFNQDKLFVGGAISIPQLTLIDSLAQTAEQPNRVTPKAAKTNSNNWQLDNFKQTFKLDGDIFTSRGSVSSLSRDLQIETTSQHNLLKQQGDTEFRFKAINFNTPERLSQLIAPIKLPLKLVTGEVQLNGQASWVFKRNEWQSKVTIDAALKQLGGAYDSSYFSGVNSQLSAQVYPEIRTEKPLRLSMSHADAGAPFTDMVVDFSLRPSTLGDLPIVDILGATTQLLQGNISLEAGAYDLNLAQLKLNVMFKNINLSELVSLQQLEDIEATGLVTGRLPLVLEGGELSVHDGQFYAIAPGGTLRYLADKDALKVNQYAETVVLALQNFQYDVLSADTEYSPDGTLLLKLRLQGNNPDFENGRPVNLNINLEQNVLKLFESLRLIDGVNDKLDKRVQDFYQRTTSP